MPLTVTTFLASSSWVLYGMQLSDAYIMVSGRDSARVCVRLSVTSRPHCHLCPAGSQRPRDRHQPAEDLAVLALLPGATSLPPPAGVRTQRVERRPTKCLDLTALMHFILGLY